MAQYSIGCVNEITSVAFGGPNLDILYVTTASDNGQIQPGAGYLYQITGLGTVGKPGVKVTLN